MWKCLTGIALGLGATYSIASMALANGKRPQATGRYDTMIVLGAKVRTGGVPTRALQYRLDVAAAYAASHPHVTIVVSGGQGADEDATEASVMKRYLIAQGIDATRIIEEDRSTSTYENILFTRELLPHMKALTIVTNDYHLERAKVLARRQGLRVDTLGAPTPARIQRKVREREKLAILRAWFFGK
jgi:uncharacterized SAM-binding protein YcdF (DUF218 family)